MQAGYRFPLRESITALRMLCTFLVDDVNCNQPRSSRPLRPKEGRSADRDRSDRPVSLQKGCIVARGDVLCRSTTPGSRSSRWGVDHYNTYLSGKKKQRVK